MKRYFIPLFVLFIACTNQSIDHDQQIYGLVINQVAYPVPPPPPPSTSTEDVQLMGASIIDSIRSVPMKIAVFPYKIKFSLKDENDKIKADSLVDYSESKIPVDFDRLIARENILLELLSGEQNNLSKIYTIYDGLLKVSDIQYNKENTKAIILVSFSRGKLSGSLIQFYLEKENDQWKIISSKTLLVS
ncbi:MAG: hypothetical protein AAF611_15005 [Bacteroidota bacterium]